MKSIGQDLHLPPRTSPRQITHCFRRCICSLPTKGCGAAASTIYIGDALLQKKFTTDTLPYKRKSNNGQKPKYYVENSNPAIVSRETFEAVRELMKSRKTDGCKRTVYPLTGKLRCPECGFAFRRQMTRNIPYWICSGRSTATTDCQSRRVKEDAVYETFNKMIFKLKSYRSELLGTLIHQMLACMLRLWQ